MNDLQIFNNPEFGEIRAVEVDGEPWFVGKDVAAGLGYSNTSDALGKHVDPEDKRGSRIATPSGEQEMTIINESGVYSLIFSSKLEKAKQFKRWVTAEVLPSIRKHGAYIAPSAPATLDAAALQAVMQHFIGTSVLLAIFFDEDLRDYFQWYVDYNLAPENRGW